MSSKFSRRTMLQGLGGLALTLPLLEARLAQAAPTANGFPKRFLVVWTPNGTVPKYWPPIGTPTAYQMSPILQPLEVVRNDVLILDGIKAVSAYNGPGDAHQRATGQCLTCTELQEGDFLGAEGRTCGLANGISVDQAIANHIGDETKFRSLQLGVNVAGSAINSRISYRGPAQPLPPENDPRMAFERLFGTPGEDPALRAARIARRKSVLDAAASRYGRVASQLPSSDREKLEAHLTMIREIEGQLDAVGTGVMCTTPEAPVKMDHLDINKFPLVGKSQMDLMAAAFACDLTRVGTLQWMNSATDKTYPWLGVHEGHHAIAHKGDEDVKATEDLRKIYTWYAEQFAYLVQKLKSIPEGNGTLLDNTFVIWISEHAKGNTHDRSQLPYVAAGSAGGSMKPGRWVKFAGDVPHSNVWLTALHMFGVEAETFGNPAYCTGTVSELAG